jgi:signal transduction histidine kinase/CheY-like chemotaxis protein
MNQAQEPIRILLVEDNAGDALLLEGMLDSTYPGGYRTAHVSSLHEAQALTQDDFDAVLLDLSLPDSQGLGTIERINEMLPRLPIVVLTGLTDAHVALEAVRGGAQDYLVKGEIDPLGLVRSVQYAIDRKRVQVALQQARDDLEQRVLERTAELQQSNQILEMFSACNQAIVRIEDEDLLLKGICRVICEIGGYRMAWVGYAQNDEKKSVRPVAHAGFEDGYLDTVDITYEYDEKGRGPMGICIREGRAVIGEDFETDPTVSPWRREALRRGYRSLISLPLTAEGAAFGALAIYAPRPSVFDARKIEILKQLADNLAYGITAIRTQKALHDSERDLMRAVEMEQRRIGQDIHDSIQGNLGAVNFMLGSVAGSLKDKSLKGPDAVKDLDKIGDIVRTTIGQARGLAKSLCPVELGGDGLRIALDHLATTTSSLFRTECRFHCDESFLIHNETIATQFYYIVHEAVNNSLKHAKASHIDIRMRQEDGHILLSVEDDGIGISAGDAASGGMGMRTMKFRARMMGANLNIRRAGQSGTVVECGVPVA